MPPSAHRFWDASCAGFLTRHNTATCLDSAACLFNGGLPGRFATWICPRTYLLGYRRLVSRHYVARFLRLTPACLPAPACSAPLDSVLTCRWLLGAPGWILVGCTKRSAALPRFCPRMPGFRLPLRRLCAVCSLPAGCSVPVPDCRSLRVGGFSTAHGSTWIFSAMRHCWVPAWVLAALGGHGCLGATTAVMPLLLPAACTRLLPACTMPLACLHIPAWNNINLPARFILTTNTLPIYRL